MNELVCDFCSSSEPRWEVVVPDFTTDLIGIDENAEMEVQQIDSIGSWLACDGCKRFVERKDLDGLADYVMSRPGFAWLLPVGKSRVSVVKETLKEPWEYVFKHRVKIQPMEKGEEDE